MSNTLIIDLTHLNADVTQSFQKALTAANNLKSALNDLSESVTNLVSVGERMINKVNQGVENGTPTLLRRMTDLAATIGGAFLVGLVGSIAGHLELARPIAEALTFGLKKAFTFITKLALGKKLILAAIVGLVAAIPLIREHGIGTVLEFVKGIGSRTAAIFVAAKEMLGNFINTVRENLPQIIATGVELLLFFKTGLLSRMSDIHIIGMQVVQWIVRAVTEGLPIAIQKGFQLMGSIREGMFRGVGKILAFAIQVVGELAVAFVEALPTIIEVGTRWIVGLISGIVTGLPALLMMAAQLVLGLAGALVTNLPALVAGGLQFVFSIIRGITGALDQITVAALTVALRFIVALSAQLPQILQTAARIPGQIARGVMQNLSQVTNVGVNLIQGLISGINRTAQQAVQAARNVVNNIVGTMRRFLGINSPSRVLRDEIGRFIPQGIAIGIQADASKAVQAMDNLSASLVVPRIQVESLIRTGKLQGTHVAASSVTKQEVHHTYHHVINNEKLFDGANIHWHNKQDIRKTMGEMAWQLQRESARLG